MPAEASSRAETELGVGHVSDTSGKSLMATICQTYRHPASVHQRCLFSIPCQPPLGPELAGIFPKDSRIAMHNPAVDSNNGLFGVRKNC